MAALIEKWRYGFYLYFSWERSSTILERILLSLCFAFFTGVLAQITIRLPFTPVPVTGQVLGVLLSSIFLGRYACISQIFYLAGGTVIPWFHGATFLSAGATTGYIIGFIPAAWIVGYCLDRTEYTPFWLIAASMITGIFVIHFSGVVWLCAVLRVGIGKGIMLGSVPFIFIDVMKAFISVGIAKAILPSRFDSTRKK